MNNNEKQNNIFFHPCLKLDFYNGELKHSLIVSYYNNKTEIVNFSRKNNRWYTQCVKMDSHFILEAFLGTYLNRFSKINIKFISLSTSYTKETFTNKVIDNYVRLLTNITINKELE